MRSSLISASHNAIFSSCNVLADNVYWQLLDGVLIEEIRIWKASSRCMHTSTHTCSTWGHENPFDLYIIKIIIRYDFRRKLHLHGNVFKRSKLFAKNDFNYKVFSIPYKICLNTWVEGSLILFHFYIMIGSKSDSSSNLQSRLLKLCRHILIDIL